jgi:hypothetical protein
LKFQSPKKPEQPIPPETARARASTETRPPSNTPQLETESIGDLSDMKYQFESQPTQTLDKLLQNRSLTKPIQRNQKQYQTQSKPQAERKQRAQSRTTNTKLQKIAKTISTEKHEANPTTEDLDCHHLYSLFDSERRHNKALNEQ